MKITNTIKTEWLPDGRLMRVLEESIFFDSFDIPWYIFKGSIINGANIPKVLWSIEGGPYTGLHRVPSVFHDEYCENRTRPHQKVHRMFYDCMIYCGMTKREAYKKYIAVRDFGPKWDEFGKDLKVNYKERYL